MEWLKDTIWCVAVGASFFGYGLAILHILGRNPRRRLAAAGVGIGVVTGLLGVMNLLSWIRPVQLVFLILIGDLLLFLLWRHLRSADVQADVKSDPPLRKCWLLKTIAWAALVCVGCSALASFHNGIVNYFDDPQAYFAYPLEALQTGSLGPQPFSERRINTSLGANYLLDAVMAVVRSIGFLDGTFAYLLFAASIWAVGRGLGLSFETKGLLLGLLSYHSLRLTQPPSISRQLCRSCFC